MVTFCGTELEQVKKKALILLLNVHIIERGDNGFCRD